MPQSMRMGRQDPKKVLLAQMFFYQFIGLFPSTCLNCTRRHLCGYESNLLRAVKCCTCLCGWKIMQQITASPATFPLAGLEHHIEIFGSEGRSET